jgi:hypothetical protein
MENTHAAYSEQPAMSDSSHPATCTYRFWITDARGVEHTPTVQATNVDDALARAVRAVSASTGDAEDDLRVGGHQVWG